MALKHQIYQNQRRLPWPAIILNKKRNTKFAV